MTDHLQNAANFIESAFREHDRGGTSSVLECLMNAVREHQKHLRSTTAPEPVPHVCDFNGTSNCFICGLALPPIRKAQPAGAEVSDDPSPGETHRIAQAAFHVADRGYGAEHARLALWRAGRSSAARELAVLRAGAASEIAERDERAGKALAVLNPMLDKCIEVEQKFGADKVGIGWCIRELTAAIRALERPAAANLRPGAEGEG